MNKPKKQKAQQNEELLTALIISQQELTQALKEQTESNRELIEALLSEEDTEEPITTYMDGTPI